MRRNLIGTAVILITLVSTLITVGCVQNDRSGIDHDDNITGDNAVSTNVSSTPASQNEMTVVGVHVTSSQFINFHGTAAFPDGTVLLSQLYEDDKPLPWWPAGQPIKLNHGQWEIQVLLGVNGAPSELLTGPGYHFNIWQQDNASIIANLHFDLVGPPPPGRP